jgi:hypothetical protein
MPVTATCHCGAVRVTVPAAPQTLTDCNCSICRKYGVLWAYYKATSVQVEAKPRALKAYSWGRKELRFVRCAKCGCVMYWEGIAAGPNSRMGVNTRNFEPKALASARMRCLDGAADHWNNVTDMRQASRFMPHVAAMLRR